MPIFITIVGMFLFIDGELDDNPGETLLGIFSIIGVSSMVVKKAYEKDKVNN